MGFEDKAEQSVTRPYRQGNGRSKQTNELTSSIVPRGTSFHSLWNSSFLLSYFVTYASCHCGLPGPAELGAINPYAVHHHGQPTRQRHDRFFLPWRLAICIAQALSHDHFFECSSMLWAAS